VSTLAQRCATLRPLPVERTTTQRSYTSIVRQSGLLQPHAPSAGDVDDPPGPRERPSPSDIPAGAAIGNALHETLERIDYARVARARDTSADLAGIVDTLLSDPTQRAAVSAPLERHGIDVRHCRTVLGWVCASLTTPIALPGASPVCLCDIDSRARMVEAEFHVAHDTAGHAIHAGAHDSLGGWVLGFIDLVFAHEGRYYVLDWKSNRMESGYSRAQIRRNMARHGYTMQARIYCLALDRWLADRLGDRYDPRAHMGGVVYVYARGVRPGCSDGTWAMTPSLRSLRDRWPAVVARVLARTRTPAPEHTP
jgi:exodeoxyribonuclease V beta subunit